MTDNRLKKLEALGQSVWYDYIRRDLYKGPELKRLVDEDGLSGMTSNPTIFQKAIAETDLYDDAIRRLSAEGRPPAALFEALAVEDVGGAADVFRPVFDRASGNSRKDYGPWDRIIVTAFSPDGRVLAAGGDDHVIHVLDMQRQEVVALVLDRDHHGQALHRRTPPLRRMTG